LKESNLLRLRSVKESDRNRDPILSSKISSCRGSRGNFNKALTTFLSNFIPVIQDAFIHKTPHMGRRSASQANGMIVECSCNKSVCSGDSWEHLAMRKETMFIQFSIGTNDSKISRDKDNLPWSVNQKNTCHNLNHSILF
jgi:hypothetical protein